jgi:predicted ATPase
MIERISIRNIKCLREVAVDLAPFTVFVGPNASGKSSILQAMDVLCRSFRGDETSFVTEYKQAKSKESSDPAEVVAYLSERIVRYRGGAISSPKWTGSGRGVSLKVDPMEWKHWRLENGGSIPLPKSMLLRLETPKLLNAGANGSKAEMAPDGSGLHAALANMALNDPDSFLQLQTDLRRIIPNIRRLRHSGFLPGGVSEVLFDMQGAESLTSSRVSEGTMLVLGLLAALYVPERPTLLLLDDLDRGLHPRAQRELISLLRALMNTHPDLQIVASTHSPYLLDCMETSEVRMTFLHADGATVCVPLSKHPSFEEWKDEMAPGEMWSMFGEKWVVEQEVAQ